MGQRLRASKAKKQSNRCKPKLAPGPRVILGMLCFYEGNTSERLPTLFFILRQQEANHQGLPFVYDAAKITLWFFAYHTKQSVFFVVKFHPRSVASF